MEELKKAILEFAEGSKKTKFYFKDMEKAVSAKIPGTKMRDVKKAATELINEGVLIYFSTGSSTMYGLKGRGMTEDPTEGAE
ncbi:MAG: dissimilatory sulfite reductase D family protein [Eubacteriales bacterium]